MNFGFAPCKITTCFCIELKHVLEVYKSATPHVTESGFAWKIAVAYLENLRAI